MNLNSNNSKFLKIQHMKTRTILKKILKFKF